MASTRHTNPGVIAGCLVALLAAATTGCTAGPATTSTPPIVYGRISYAVAHTSVAEARADSDLVVVGAITELVRVEEDLQVPGLPVSVYRIHVQRGLMGARVDDVLVRARGGVLNGVKYEMADEDPVVIGERDVFFLTRIASGPYAGLYFLSNPDCRITIRSNGSLATRGNLRLDPNVVDVDSLAATLQK
jgi:hypothetical protein